MNELELTADELAEAALIEDNLKAIFAVELPRISHLLASRKNRELFGETEFTLRDILHRIGVRGLEAALEERKKRGIKEPASSAPTVRKPRGSSIIDPAKSRPYWASCIMNGPIITANIVTRATFRRMRNSG